MKTVSSLNTVTMWSWKWQRNTCTINMPVHCLAERFPFFRLFAILYEKGGYATVQVVSCRPFAAETEFEPWAVRVRWNPQRPSSRETQSRFNRTTTTGRIQCKLQAIALNTWTCNRLWRRHNYVSYHSWNIHKFTAEFTQVGIIY
jgi:hypothetical protein